MYPQVTDSDELQRPSSLEGRTHWRSPHSPSGALMPAPRILDVSRQSTVTGPGKAPAQRSRFTLAIQRSSP